MKETGTTPWEDRFPECFQRGLRELSRSGGARLFHPVEAGTYVVSIQASRAHASVPRHPAPADAVEAWEVAVFDQDGRRLDERHDPELAALPAEWLRYWRGGVGRFVPSAMVHVILDRLAHGPDRYDRSVLEDPG